MIRIRTLSKDPNKHLIKLPSDAVFVEICDSDGKIACIVSFDELNNKYTIFDGDSDKAKRYQEIFNAEFISKHYDLNKALINNKK